LQAVQDSRRRLCGRGAGIGVFEFQKLGDGAVPIEDLEAEDGVSEALETDFQTLEPMAL
jgi:hypothetical protein